MNSFRAGQQSVSALRLAMLVSTAVVVVASTLLSAGSSSVAYAANSGHRPDIGLMPSQVGQPGPQGTAPTRSEYVGNTAMTGAAPPQLTMAQILGRALNSLSGKADSTSAGWYKANGSPPYNQSGHWLNSSDYWVPGGTDPGGWREDCSGFVAQAWDYPSPGFTVGTDGTFSANNYAGWNFQYLAIGGVGSWPTLQPGDAITFNDHVALVASVNGNPNSGGSFDLVEEFDTALGTIYGTVTESNIGSYIGKPPLYVVQDPGLLLPSGYQMAFQAYQTDQLWTVGSAGWTDTGLGFAAGTSPSITAVSNGYEVAFQAYGGDLWTYGNAGTADQKVGLAANTSPSIAALKGGGYEIAFQSNGGQLWTVGTAGWTNWGLGMAPGTSPSIAGLSDGGFQVAFNAYGSNLLWTVSNTLGVKNDWNVGLASGTSPTVAAISGTTDGYEVAFQSNGGQLWTVGTAGWTNWGLGMAAGTSPSIAGLTGSGYQVAFNAYDSNHLWLEGTLGPSDTGQVMASGTSPSIVAAPNNGFEVAIQSSVNQLQSLGSLGSTNWGVGMAAGTSPSIE